MPLGIQHITIAHPDNVISTKSILDHMGHQLSDSFKESLGRLGVDSRYSIVEEYDAYLANKKKRCLIDSTSQMASRAVNKVIDESNVDPNDIGLLIAISNTPDRLLPCTAYEVLAKSDKRLQRDINVLNLLGQGCATMNKAMDVAQAFHDARPSKKVLIVIAEGHTGAAPPLKERFYDSLAHIDPKDTKNLDETKAVVSTILFGDAACAMLLDNSKDNRLKFFPSVHQSVLSPHDTELLTLNHGGILHPVYEGFPHYHMDKRVPAKGVVYVKNLLKLLTPQLEHANISMDHMDQFFLHTGSDKIIKAIANFLGILPENQEKHVGYSFKTLSKFANLSAASVPVMIHSYFKDLIKLPVSNKPSHHIMFSFGVGFSASSCIIQTQ